MTLKTAVGPARAASVAASAALAALGLVYAAGEGMSSGALCRACGGVFVLAGLSRAAGYLSDDLYKLAFQHDLAFGGLLAVLGAALALRRDVPPEAVCTLAGGCSLTDGLLKVQTALDGKRFGLGGWGAILSAALAACAAGLLAVLRAWRGGALRAPTGCALVCEGALCALTVLLSAKAPGGKGATKGEDEGHKDEF